MKKEFKKCSISYCNGQVWGRGLCSFHYKLEFNKPLKKKPISKKPTERALKKKEEKKEYTELQFKMFQEIYQEAKNKVCFECGSYVNGESSANFHHILEKGIEKYEKYALCKWNIVILCTEHHNQAHSNIDLVPKVKQLTEELKKKYG